MKSKTFYYTERALEFLFLGFSFILTATFCFTQSMWFIVPALIGFLLLARLTFVTLRESDIILKRFDNARKFAEMINNISNGDEVEMFSEKFIVHTQNNDYPEIRIDLHNTKEAVFLAKHNSVITITHQPKVFDSETVGTFFDQKYVIYKLDFLNGKFFKKSCEYRESIDNNVNVSKVSKMSRKQLDDMLKKITSLPVQEIGYIDVTKDLNKH